jgi:hypothetical protein
MRYAAFRSAGLCTSTGVVEAARKTTIGTHCKRAGMHWTVAGADAIITPTLLQIERTPRGLPGAPRSAERGLNALHLHNPDGAPLGLPHPETVRRPRRSTFHN